MSAFPVTDWRRIDVLRTGSAGERDAVFAELFERYKDPVLRFLRRRGYAHEHAEDVVQDFFLYCLTDQVFAQADATRGRFRNLMLRALQRYAAKQHRHDTAQKRHPDAGFVSADTSGRDGAPLDVSAGESSPETEFARAWAEALIARVMLALRRQFSGPDRGRHFDIFYRFLVAPLLTGAETPSQQSLAREHGLTEKEVANRLVTAKRAYRELLREEIRAYAIGDDEVEQEVRDLFQILGIGA